jgi:hypothetical protein
MNYLSGRDETLANVAVLWTVARWLNHVGADSFDGLAAALRPVAVVKGADHALRGTLQVGRHIGVLHAEQDSEKDSGQWSIGPRLPHEAVVDHRSFRAAVRAALLTQAVEDASADRQPADVAIGLTWLCSLDPALPLPWSWYGTTELAVRDAGLRDIINSSTQWVAFRRWALSLGMATPNDPRGAVQVLIPDATTAVAETLPSLPTRSTAPRFLEALAARIPAVDNGALERVAVNFGVVYSARGDARLGPVLAHALRRLDHRGAIRLRKTDDASHRVSFRTAAGTDSFDEVEIVQPSYA